MFPQYRALQELAGADRMHPADLWRDDWQWRDVRPPTERRTARADVAARSAMEAQMLALMRGATPALASAE